LRELSADVVVVGGGLGGVAAALSAVRLGRTVLLTEETDWLGGQLTSQVVPLDEHKWIEETGCTRTYRQLRDGIRQYYREHYPMLPGSRSDPHLNPGMGFISRMCCEPRVALAVIEQMLAPYRAAGLLRVLLNTKPVAVTTDGDDIALVTVTDSTNGCDYSLVGRYFLDATELGDLLELGNVEHVVGAESQEETGEPHALAGAPNPLDQQAVTWVFAVDWAPQQDNVIERPAQYDFWRGYRAPFWPGPQLGWDVSDAITAKPLFRPLLINSVETPVDNDLWHFRRLLCKGHFDPALVASDIVSMNFAGLDYWLKPFVGVSEEEKRAAFDGARQLSLSMLHWMQTEAPRHDGGTGYPELRPRPDVTGTPDGLAKVPYYRESRRIKAAFTVLEQHVGVEARGELEGAEHFEDSVGVGAMRIDLHPSTAPRNYVDVDAWPFQIPLGALIPVRVGNLLPACKNVGTTHITNGAYRVHPVEWGIGEAAGALAAFCLDKMVPPRAVHEQAGLRDDFQSVLTQRLGVQLEWPVVGVIGPEQRFGSPSAIFGGTWVSEGADGLLRAAGAGQVNGRDDLR
jgi:hypothetical protein